MIRIDVHIHSDGSSATADALLADILHRLTHIEAHMADLTQSVADLTASVAAEKTVEDSAIVLLNNLTTLIAALKTTQTDPATAAAIDALTAQVGAQKQALADAVVLNTPAA